MKVTWKVVYPFVNIGFTLTLLCFCLFFVFDDAISFGMKCLALSLFGLMFSIRLTMSVVMVIMMAKGFAKRKESRRLFPWIDEGDK